MQRLGLAQWPIATGLPLAVLLFAYGIVWLLGIARIDTSGLAAFGGPDMIALNIAVTMFYCFGEEIGWRGYLLPKLMPLGESGAARQRPPAGHPAPAVHQNSSKQS